MKRDENVNFHGKRQFTEAQDEMIYMLELFDRNSKAAIIKLLKHVIMNILETNGNFLKY